MRSAASRLLVMFSWRVYIFRIRGISRKMIFKLENHPIFEYLQTPVIIQTVCEYLLMIFLLYFRVLLVLPILGSGGVLGTLTAMLSWCCPWSWCQITFRRAKRLSCFLIWRRTVWWTTWPIVTLEGIIQLRHPPILWSLLESHIGSFILYVSGLFFFALLKQHPI